MKYALATSRQPPVEVSHASSCVLLAELAPVAAAVALDVVEDFLSQLHDSRCSSCPCSNRGRGSEVCIGDFRAVGQRRTYTPDHARCRLSLLLLQQLGN